MYVDCSDFKWRMPKPKEYKKMYFVIFTNPSPYLVSKLENNRDTRKTLQSLPNPTTDHQTLAESQRCSRESLSTVEENYIVSEVFGSMSKSSFVDAIIFLYRMRACNEATNVPRDYDYSRQQNTGKCLSANQPIKFDCTFSNHLSKMWQRYKFFSNTVETVTLRRAFQKSRFNTFIDGSDVSLKQLGLARQFTFRCLARGLYTVLALDGAPVICLLKGTQGSCKEYKVLNQVLDHAGPQKLLCLKTKKLKMWSHFVNSPTLHDIKQLSGLNKALYQSLYESYVELPTSNTFRIHVHYQTIKMHYLTSNYILMVIMSNIIRLIDKLVAKLASFRSLTSNAFSAVAVTVMFFEHCTYYGGCSVLALKKEFVDGANETKPAMGGSVLLQNSGGRTAEAINHPVSPRLKDIELAGNWSRALLGGLAEEDDSHHFFFVETETSCIIHVRQKSLVRRRVACPFQNHFKNINRFEAFDLEGAKLVPKDLTSLHAVSLVVRLRKRDVFVEKVKNIYTSTLYHHRYLRKTTYPERQAHSWRSAFLKLHHRTITLRVESTGSSSCLISVLVADYANIVENGYGLSETSYIKYTYTNIFTDVQGILKETRPGHVCLFCPLFSFRNPVPTIAEYEYQDKYKEWERGELDLIIAGYNNDVNWRHYEKIALQNSTYAYELLNRISVASHNYDFVSQHPLIGMLKAKQQFHRQLDPRAPLADSYINMLIGLWSLIVQRASSKLIVLSLTEPKYACNTIMVLFESKICNWWIQRIQCFIVEDNPDAVQMSSIPLRLVAKRSLGNIDTLIAHVATQLRKSKPEGSSGLQRHLALYSAPLELRRQRESCHGDARCRCRRRGASRRSLVLIKAVMATEIPPLDNSFRNYADDTQGGHFGTEAAVQRGNCSELLSFLDRNQWQIPGRPICCHVSHLPQAILDVEEDIKSSPKIQINKFKKSGRPLECTLYADISKINMLHLQMIDEEACPIPITDMFMVDLSRPSLSQQDDVMKFDMDAESRSALQNLGLIKIFQMMLFILITIPLFALIEGVVAVA
nr:unnamed protein product [Callosobruchus analis]